MKAGRRCFKGLLWGLILVLAAAPAGAESLVAQYTGDHRTLVFGGNPLTQPPEYAWYYGCSPTAAGMLMGYWSGQGFTSLLPGVTDPMVQTAAVNNAMASPEHIKAGHDLGYTYGSYQNHSPNSIADFMLTDNAGTYYYNMPGGLRDWAAYTGVATKTSYYELVGYWSGPFTYDSFKAEINAGRPMVLNLITYAPGKGWVGHSVVGYGYQDNMFNLQIPLGGGSSMNVTVPGFAVRDTWVNGVGPGKQSEWLGWDDTPVYAALDAQGREWWPFLDLTATNGASYTGYWDWQVDDGVFYQPIPLPPSALLLASGGLLILLRRRLTAPK
jgi:hypothetical protein